MKTGLVFSGGGSRGAYQIGVWKALNELNITCDIVVGTSIGSINAALYVQGSLELAEKMWKEINFTTVFDEDYEAKNNKELYRKYFKSARNGGIEPINLQNNLDKFLNLDKFYESDINYGLVTVSYPKMKEIQLEKKKIARDKLTDYIIASSTVFPVFKIKEIDNERYVDGGFKNAVPIDLAKKLGAEKLIIVNISIVAKNLKVEKSENIVMIKPNNKMGFPLKFDSKIAKRNMRYGYNDTMKVFKKLDGKKYTFKNLKEKFVKCELFPTFDAYIRTLEYIGKHFDIDDSKIYRIDQYNQLLFQKLLSIQVDTKKKIRDLITTNERIVYIYKTLETKKRNNFRKIFPREYKAAYYLYLNN